MTHKPHLSTIILTSRATAIRHRLKTIQLICPPTPNNGKLHFEGAAVDCLNCKCLVEKHPEVDTIVDFDVLGSDKLFREPIKHKNGRKS